MSSASWADSERPAAIELPIALSIESIARGLSESGWWSGEHCLDDSTTRALREELEELDAAERLHRAGIGRELGYQVDGAVRRDRIHWLGRQRPRQAAFLDVAETLRVQLNRTLFLALFEFECHFALYPPDAFYRRHVDSFRGAANRVVSLVAFLNPDWQPGHGGELVLYAQDETTEIIRIAPRAGTLVLFMSEEVPHEVLPTRVARASIAGWYRLNASIAGQIDPPR